MLARTPAGPSGRRLLASSLAAGFLLAGCASTHSSDVASARPQTNRAPSHIVIVVTEAIPTKDQDRLTPQEKAAFAKALQTALDQRMNWLEDGVTISDTGAPRPPLPDTFVLQCTVTQLRQGSQTWRLMVGFGAGRATLGVATQLVDLRGRTPVELASFRTSSTTGSMPGPGLGLAGAAASASAIGLAGGSVGVFMGARQTINHEFVQSSQQIVTQLQTYFADNDWPSVPPSVPAVVASDTDLAPPQPLTAPGQSSSE